MAWHPRAQRLFPLVRRGRGGGEVEVRRTGRGRPETRRPWNSSTLELVDPGTRRPWNSSTLELVDPGTQARVSHGQHD